MLEPERGGLYLDGTVGGGGHAAAILKRGPEARVLACDRDPDALAAARRTLEPFGDRVKLERGNYADVAGRLTEPLAGALLDLGVSSWQIDEAARGFSFREGTPLDMRMAGPSDPRPTAADLLNNLAEADLVDLFRRYGEEPRARRLAREVVRRRAGEPFTTSRQLLDAITAALGARSGVQDRARIFQALRIAVNRELEDLSAALPLLRDALQPLGVLAVLAYHSLEDREVKHAFREWSRDCVCPPRLPVCRCRGKRLGDPVTKRPVRPSADEVARNPRARSARLRAWRKAA